jgi:hypothetical protein
MMGKVHESITPEIQAFIRKQHVFFVATAPLSADGHVNVSPKGLDCFRILSASQVAYLDLTGSGNETSAHLLENGRVTLMFCGFDGAPNIVRLYGRGRTLLPDTPEWDSLIYQFPTYNGTRQIILADIDRVSTSCGYAVPLYSYEGERDTLLKWADRKGEDGLTRYRHEKNECSIDGLPTPLAQQSNE